MHDEFRGSLARQGITEEAYSRSSGKTDADLHADFRPDAEKRVKACSCSRRSPRPRASTVPDADVEAEVARGRERYAGDAKLVALLRVGARPELHPQHAPPQPRRRAARRRAGWPPIPSTRRSRTSRTAPAARVDADAGRRPTPRSTRPTRARSSSSRTAATPRHDRDRSHEREPARPAEPHRDPVPDRTAAGEAPDARPDGHRVLQPGRARLRHLLAPAPGADHLPRRRDRGPPRQPGHRPAAVPRVGGPGEGHQPVHQLARRRRDVRPRDLRHDAVPAGAGQHDLHRHGGVDGGGPAGGRRARASATPCRTAGS